MPPKSSAVAIMDAQRPLRVIDYSQLPNPATDTCLTCHWSAIGRGGDSSMRTCHFTGASNNNPTMQQRSPDWWCNNFIPKKKKMAEVNEE